MKTVKILIIDDEPLARSTIKRLLKKDEDVEVIGEAADGGTALAEVKRLKPDLIFLDVQMPVMTGVELLAQLKPNQRPAVIFVTAYDEHAITAFELHAVDYLLKPFQDERFFTALERAKERANRRDVAQLSDHVTEVLAALRQMPPAKMAPAVAATKPAERLIVKVSGEFHFISPADIRWIEGHGDYLKIHCKSEAPLIRDTFKDLQQRLDPTRFVRIHKSVMVNTDFVRRLRPAFSGDYTVELDDGTNLRVSRLYKVALQQFL